MMQFQSLARYAEVILDQNARSFTPAGLMIQAQQEQAFESMKKTFPQTPKPDVVLYDILANRVRSQDYQSVGQLAGQYRNRMENIGKLRPSSSYKTAKRRMQEILNEHVYGVRVPQHELPLLVINGRITGGQRLYDDIHFSNGHTS